MHARETCLREAAARRWTVLRRIKSWICSPTGLSMTCNGQRWHEFSGIHRSCGYALSAMRGLVCSRGSALQCQRQSFAAMGRDCLAAQCVVFRACHGSLICTYCTASHMRFVGCCLGLTALAGMIAVTILAGFWKSSAVVNISYSIVHLTDVKLDTHVTGVATHFGAVDADLG